MSHELYTPFKIFKKQAKEYLKTQIYTEATWKQLNKPSRQMLIDCFASVYVLNRLGIIEPENAKRWLEAIPAPLPAVKQPVYMMEKITTYTINCKDYK